MTKSELKRVNIQKVLPIDHTAVLFDISTKLELVIEQNQEMRKRMDMAKDIICGEYPKGDDRYIWAVENL